MTDRYRSIDSLKLSEEARSDFIEVIKKFEAAEDKPSELSALSSRATACRAAARLLSDHPKAIQFLSPSLVDVLAGSLQREHETAADALFKTGLEDSIQHHAALALSMETGFRMIDRYRSADVNSSRLTAVLGRTIIDSQSDDARRAALRTLVLLIPLLDPLPTETTFVRRLSNALCQLLHEDLSNAETRVAVEVLAYLSEYTPADVPAESVRDALEAAVSSFTIRTSIKAFESDGNPVDLDGAMESTLAAWSDAENDSFASIKFDDYDRALVEGFIPIIFSNLDLNLNIIPIDMPWLTPGAKPRDALAKFVRTTNPTERKKAAVVFGEIVALIPDTFRIPDSLVDRVQRARGTEYTEPARALGELAAIPEDKISTSVLSLAAQFRVDRETFGTGGKKVLGEVAAATPDLFDCVPSALVDRADMVGEPDRDGPILALGTVAATGAGNLDAAVERIAERARTCDDLHRMQLIRVLGEVSIAEPTCVPEVPMVLRERARAEESNSHNNLRALGEVVAAVVSDDHDPVEVLISLVREPDDTFAPYHHTTHALGELVATDPSQVADALEPLVVHVQRTEGYARERAAKALGDVVATDPSNVDAAVTALVERVTRGERSGGKRIDRWWSALVLGEVVVADPDRFDAIPDTLIECVAATTNLGRRLLVGTLGELVAAAEGTDMAVIECFVERARMPANESRPNVFPVLGMAVAYISPHMETVPDSLIDRVMQISGDRWGWYAGVLGEIVAAHRYDTDRALEALADRLYMARGSTRMRCAQAIGEIVATSPRRLDSQTAQFVQHAQATQGKQRCRWLRLTGHIHVSSYPGAVRHLCSSLAVSDGTQQEESLKALLALAHTEEVTPKCFLKNATVAVGEELSELVDLTPYLSLNQKPRHQFLIVVREFLSTATSGRQFTDLRTQLRSLLTNGDEVATPTRLLITDILTHLDGECLS